MAGSKLTDEDKALVAAMELLRKQLGDNTLAIAANTQRTDADFQRQAEAARTFLDAAAEARVGDPRTADGRKGAEGYRTDPRPPGGRPQADVDGSPAGPPRGARLAGAAGGAAVGVANSGASAVTNVLGQVASSFRAVAGPAAILAQVLAAPISGFQLLGQTVKVLATAIAPILLPATVALSGAILAVSEILFQKGGPLMDSFFDIIFNFAVPAIEWLINSFDEASDMMVEAAEWVLRQVRSFDPEEALKDVGEYTGVYDRDPADDISLPRFARGERSAGEDAVDRGMRDALTSLRMSMGPKASIGDVAGIGRSAQMAALNADPIEQRLMKMQLDALNRIEASLARRRGGGRVYDPTGTGPGDFSRDPGAGGSFDSGYDPDASF